ncbi:MAG: hypothetical protein K5756_07530 [Clostridiales bacterium]|nr:hypothetical protein [Clostridiales bacterium]
MQVMKRALSVLLCCALLAAFAPMVCAEDKILIEKVSATYTVPAAGEPFYFNAITVPDDANYTAEIKQVYYKEDGYKHLADGDIVEKGRMYCVRIRFTANSGYRLEYNTTEYTINGIVATIFGGTDMPEVTFVPISLDYVQLNVPEDATVDYKEYVTVIATASGLPAGYFVALYEGETLLAKGDNTTVRCYFNKMRKSKTITAKVIDAGGNVQSNAYGRLEKDITVTVNTGLFSRLRAFIRELIQLIGRPHPYVVLEP